MDHFNIGDIIIFEAGDDFISKSIAFLTDSTVTHSAMIYSSNQMVEMIGSGITVSDISVDDAARKAHFLRITPSQDATPLLEAAKSYVDKGIEYDFPSLILLGGLLIYRNVRPTKRWAAITNTILYLATMSLDKLLNLITHKGKKAKVMMCSQLVYQCYFDAGYQIKFKSGLLKGEQNDAFRLIDMIEANDGLLQSSENHVYSVPSEVNEDLLAQELYHALSEGENAHQDFLLGAEQLSATSGIAIKFLDLLNKILEAMESTIPLSSLFVTPNDLYTNTYNLEHYGDNGIKKL